MQLISLRETSTTPQLISLRTTADICWYLLPCSWYFTLLLLSLITTVDFHNSSVDFTHHKWCLVTWAADISQGNYTTGQQLIANTPQVPYGRVDKPYIPQGNCWCSMLTSWYLIGHQLTSNFAADITQNGWHTHWSTVDITHNSGMLLFFYNHAADVYHSAAEVTHNSWYHLHCSWFTHNSWCPLCCSWYPLWYQLISLPFSS